MMKYYQSRTALNGYVALYLNLLLVIWNVPYSVHSFMHSFIHSLHRKFKITFSCTILSPHPIPAQDVPAARKLPFSGFLSIVAPSEYLQSGTQDGHSLRTTFVSWEVGIVHVLSTEVGRRYGGYVSYRRVYRLGKLTTATENKGAR